MTHYEGDDLETLSRMHRYHAWVVSVFTPFLSGRVVEFGAGIGTMSARFLEHIERLSLVEPSPPLAEILRRRFAADKRVSIYEDSLERHVKSFQEAPYDAAVLINVLEHIEADEPTLFSMARIIRPGGHLLLFVPALQWLFSELDRKHGHYRRYERSSLMGIVQRSGFEIVSARYFDLFGVLPWWLINTVGRQMAFNPGLAVLYDRWTVPVSRTLERLIAPPVGKNIYVVARRAKS